MRSSVAQGQDGAPGVTRRAVRLLVLLGVGFAAYLVLSLFDHAAQAADGPIGHLGAADPLASVKAVAANARTAIPAPKSTSPKSTAAKISPQKARTGPPQATAAKASPAKAIKKLQVSPSKAKARTKIHAAKVRVSRTIEAPTRRADETVRQLQIRTKIQLRNATQIVVTPTRTAVRQILPTPATLTDLPWAALAALNQLPQAQLPALPQLPSRPQLPSLPQTHLPSLPQAPTTTTALPHQPPTPPMSAQVCPLPPPDTPAAQRSGVPKPRTSPPPAPPRQPADYSTLTGQVRDSGGGNAPAMGTVPLSWRPEVAAAGRCAVVELTSRGRTVRYAGPPS